MGNHGGNEGSPISHEYINNIISCPHPTPCLDSTSKFLPIIVRVKMRFYASPVNNNPSSISPFIIRRLATRFFLPAIHESSLYSSIASIKNTHTPRNVLKKKRKKELIARCWKCEFETTKISLLRNGYVTLVIIKSWQRVCPWRTRRTDGSETYFNGRSMQIAAELDGARERKSSQPLNGSYLTRFERPLRTSTR